MIDTDFTDAIPPALRVAEIGHGRVQHTPGEVRLSVPPTPARVYSDAQLSSYTSRVFDLRPPLRMSVTARFDALPAVGTAGFGLWNQPFMPGQRGLALPQALWFFYSAPPNNMALAQGVPGHGWKAATFNARRWQFAALLPAALPGFLLLRIPALYRRLWRVGQAAIGVQETLLDPALLTGLHRYTLDWLPERAVFAVDGAVVLDAPVRINRPLGFIVWIDNQYAIVTPQGRFGFGLSPVAQEQALLLDSVSLTSLRMHAADV